MNVREARATNSSTNNNQLIMNKWSSLGIYGHSVAINMNETATDAIKMVQKKRNKGSFVHTTPPQSAESKKKKT